MVLVSKGNARDSEALARNLLWLPPMAYPVRRFDPQTLYFITSRTLQSRLLMKPDAKINELIGGVLARAVRQCGVELFAYVFMSNHFHLIVRAPSAIAMSRFMQRLQSNLAVKVGRLVNWRGRFFARRYSAEPIVDEGAQVARLAYVLSHGVKENLVSEVLKWPGLSCARALLEGRAQSQHRWRNWTRRWEMEVHQAIHVDRFSEACPSEDEALTLTPLPCWSGLSPQERSEAVAALIANIEATARGRPDKKSAEAIAAREPHDQPRRSKHSPRPKAHASSLERWIAAVREYGAFLTEFRQAAKSWLAGRFDTVFPPHCFAPPTWSVPRIV